VAPGVTGCGRLCAWPCTGLGPGGGAG
jgi:hypothetical protein